MSAHKRPPAQCRHCGMANSPALYAPPDQPASDVTSKPQTCCSLRACATITHRCHMHTQRTHFRHLWKSIHQDGNASSSRDRPKREGEGRELNPDPKHINQTTTRTLEGFVAQVRWALVLTYGRTGVNLKIATSIPWGETPRMPVPSPILKKPNGIKMKQ